MMTSQHYLRNCTGILASFSPEVRAAIEIVVIAGLTVRSMDRTAQKKAHEGFRSIVTVADEQSQQLSIDRLHRLFPHARFLCEESSAHTQVLPSDSPVGIDTGLVFIKDPLDGTTSFSANIGNWCVTIGVLVEGQFLGSAVFAPATNGGFLLFSEKGRGVYTVDWDGDVVAQVESLPNLSPRDSIAFLGADTLLYPAITNTIPTLAAHFRGAYTSAAGELGLALVAAGRAQLIVQTPQKVWDWAAAYCAVLEMGLTMRFFRLRDGVRIAVSEPDFEAFCFAREHRLGFVAGQEHLVQGYWNLLPNTGWQRTKPLALVR